jgi:hypothetical protein
MTSILAAAEGFAGVAIPAVGLLYTYTANRRAQYDRVLVMTDQSCTSPISDDRHVAGTAFEPTWKHPPGEPVKLSEAEIKAVFNVLWYFDRASALYVSLRPPIWVGHITRAQRLLLDSLAAAVETWAGYLAFSWVDEDGRAIDATHATFGLLHLVSENARLMARPQEKGDALTSGELLVGSATPNAPPGERRGAVGLAGSRLLHENGRVWEAPGQFWGVAGVEDLCLA